MFMFLTWLSLALSATREIGNLFICIQYTKRIKNRSLGREGGVLYHLHCTQGGPYRLQLFKDANKNEAILVLCFVWYIFFMSFRHSFTVFYHRKTALQRLTIVLWTWSCFWKDLQKATEHLKAPLRSSGAECGALMKSYWGIKAQKAFNVSHSIHYKAFNAGWLELHVRMTKRAQVY